MRKTREFLLGPEGETNYYHVVSRVAGRELLFGDEDKEVFRIILLKQLKFSGLRALAWCFMGNHFHLLLEVPGKETALKGWKDEDYIERLGVLRSEWSTRQLLGEVAMFRETGYEQGISEIAERVKKRLFDLSMFMKELKMKMTAAYNKAHERNGALWEGRFKSVLLEGGEGSEALRAVAAYIDLNPVRAGLVADPVNYRWCSYAAAVAGVRGARQGLNLAVTGKRRVSWSRVAEDYRCLLYHRGEMVEGEHTVDGMERRRRGFTAEEIESVWESGGKLSLGTALHCRVRYFTDGAVLGSQSFVDCFFASKRAHFGGRRRSGGRKMRHAEWGELRILRDLKVDGLSVS